MHDHSTIYTDGTGAMISNNKFLGKEMVNSAAIEVHGANAKVTGNYVSGYYRGANILASGTTFKGNHVYGAANPVDLWSFAPAALRDVKITGNVLNRNRAYWRHVLPRHNLSVPPASYMLRVIRNPTSTLPFYNITIRSNKG